METNDLKELIVKEIAKTESIIEEYREMTKPVTPDVAIGRISRIDAMHNNSVAALALRQAEDKLRNLQRVLAKVGTKDFGICVKCQKPIPIGRILIRPESLFCVNCAS